MKIKLPSNIKAILEADLFEVEDSLDPTLLKKLLYYMPEVLRIFGVAVGKLKADKRELEHELDLRRAQVLAELSESIDSHKYKNEQMRLAYVEVDFQYGEIRKKINAVEGEMEQLQEYIWKYKNLLHSLDNITKLRVMEGRL